VEEDVLTGRSASRRLQPREFMESLKEFEAIMGMARAVDSRACPIATLEALLSM
jgi:hypothetical protein